MVCNIWSFSNNNNWNNYNMVMKMFVYNRETNKIEEKEEYGEKILHFLYDTYIGRIILKLFVARPFFSKLRAKKQKSIRSKEKIKQFIEKYKIDMSEYDDEYDTFNDFFIRKRKIENKSKQNELVAIADSNLIAYNIDENLKIDVKYSTYNLEELLNEKLDISKYKNGYCLIFRLSIDDYHRYVFPDDGKYIKRYHINGILHTVRPISSRYRVYSRNTREVSVLQTENLGEIIQIEIGALLVGCIKNNDVKSFKKLDEKGYFEYGGSTIILLLKDNVKIDEDIIENSKKSIETKVKIGEKVGIIYDSND